MASLVPLKEKRLMEVKLGELPSWILMRDFTPSGIAGAFGRRYDRNYKYITVRKGSVLGVNTVLAAYMVCSYCIYTRNSNVSGDASTTEEGSLEGTAWPSITTCSTPI